MIEGAPNDTMQQQQGEPSHASPSPSFSSYSSETLAEIAARVINELHCHPQNDDHDDDLIFQPWENDDDDNFTPQNDDDQDNPNYNTDNENDDFEFAFVLRDPKTSPVSAEDIFYNGQIRPMYMYPVFGAPLKDAVPSASPVPNFNDEASTTRRRLPLRKLMFEERETGSCSSSTSENESVDLEGVPEGTYCVWNPNATVAKDRKKSKSTGSSSSSSKRWKLRELLLRSHSEGKGKNNSLNGGGNNDDDKKRAFVFGVPSKRTSKVAATKAGSGDGYGGASAERDGKSGTKSALPYRQELVGLFANVNGLGRNLHPF